MVIPLTYTVLVFCLWHEDHAVLAKAHPNIEQDQLPLYSHSN